jgi:hypothetical protein
MVAAFPRVFAALRARDAAIADGMVTRITDSQGVFAVVVMYPVR